MRGLGAKALLLAGVAACAATPVETSAAQPAPSTPSAHDRAYFEELLRKKTLPDGASADALLRELEPWLGSGDPALRDELAVGLATRWIRGGLVSDEEMRAARDRLLQNLGRGIGERGTDGVLLRSFSALTLDAIAARDLEKPFLSAEERHALTTSALDYLEREKDLRAWDAKRGWIHATAHTADVLRHLMRNPSLSAADVDAITAGLEAKLTAVDVVFTHGENRRLAQVVIALLARPDCRAEPVLAWLARHQARNDTLWKAPAIDPVLYVQVENQVQLFHEVLALLWTLPSDNACAKSVREAMVGRR